MELTSLNVEMTLPGLGPEGGSSLLLLLSLQPQYWNLIVDGKKKYEYRRAFRKDAVQAYIYLSSPRKEIAGSVDFGPPIIDSVESIARIAERGSGSIRGHVGLP